MNSGNTTLARFWDRLRAARAGILMLDYDGTLAPFTRQRDKAFPYPGIAARLGRLLSSARTRIVIVTGRDVSDLLRLFPLAQELEVWGSHGLERRFRDGSSELPDIGADQAERLQQARRASERLGLAEYLEEKYGCMAQHWRGICDPSMALITGELVPVWTRLAGDGLQLREFDGGIELRSMLANKSRAVDWLKREAGPHSLLAYLGDDLTDEDAFRELGTNDIGVLVRRDFRMTQAKLWLKPPEQLLAFFDGWLEAMGMPPGEE
jgi:trehalose-phosphatase